MSPPGGRGATRKKDIGQIALFSWLRVLMIPLFTFSTGTQNLLPNKA